MSVDPPPPDLIRTAEFPLDELAVKLVETVQEAPPVGRETRPEALFGAVRTVGPRASFGASDPEAAILEGSERPFTLRMAPSETIHKIRALVSAGRWQGQPLYRKHGTLAVIGLCLLGIVVTLSLPRTQATLGSDVRARADELEPAAPAGVGIGSNRDDAIDAIGSDGLFIGSKTERALGQPATDGSTTSTVKGGTGSTTATVTTVDSDQLPTLAELLETSVIVGPDPTSCPVPGAVPPDCEPATTVTTAAPSTEPASTATTVTTVPTTRPPTTSAPTTAKPTTTTSGSSTTSTTGSSTTGSTVGTTTSSSSVTTVSTDPEDTTPETTEPGGPNESPGPTVAPVVCTPGSTEPGETVPPSEPGLPGPPGQSCPGSSTTTTSRNQPQVG